MAGTKEGGQKAKLTNQAKFDEAYLHKYGMTFYQYIGSIGGKHKGKKGFALDRELARKAGSIGGKKSRRGKQIIE